MRRPPALLCPRLEQLLLASMIYSSQYWFKNSILRQQAAIRYLNARISHLTGDTYSPPDPMEDSHLACLNSVADIAGQPSSIAAPNEINVE